MPAKKSSPSNPKPTSERITLNGEKKPRVVYVGPKGGKYILKKGVFMALPKSGTFSQKAGGPPFLLLLK